MISVEDWAEIRRLHKVEKMSKRAIATRLGIHRDTVSRALASDEPPRYQRTPRGSVLDPFDKLRTGLTNQRYTRYWLKIQT